MSVPADLAPERIAVELRSARYGRSLDVRAETSSTNDDARRALEVGAPDGHVIVADRQRAGRGSRGRRWDSPGGTDLYFSIVARVPLAPVKLPPLTLAVGLAVARAIEPFVPLARVEVKWPNDVWIDRAKCAGILVEATARGATLEGVVIGIGVDVNRPTFADELAGVATSLHRASGLLLERPVVLARALESVESEIDRLVAYGAAPIVRRVEERLALRGERVACDEVEGTLLGLSAIGALRLETASGIRELVAGTLRAR